MQSLRCLIMILERSLNRFLHPPACDPLGRRALFPGECQARSGSEVPPRRAWGCPRCWGLALFWAPAACPDFNMSDLASQSSLEGSCTPPCSEPPVLAAPTLQLPARAGGSCCTQPGARCPLPSPALTPSSPPVPGPPAHPCLHLCFSFINILSKDPRMFFPQ